MTRYRPPTKTCEICGGLSYGRRHRVCFLGQRWSGHSQTATCEHCGAVFAWNASEGTRRFCGWRCYWAAGGSPHHEAWRASVGRALRGRRPRNSLRWQGPDHPRWNPDREAVRVRRTDPEYAAWRHAVYSRDGWTCQDCGQRGGELNAHHLAEWAKAPAQRYDLENGLTLCVQCHYRRHGRRYRARNAQTPLGI